MQFYYHSTVMETNARPRSTKKRSKMYLLLSCLALSTMGENTRLFWNTLKNQIAIRRKSRPSISFVSSAHITWPLKVLNYSGILSISVQYGYDITRKECENTWYISNECVLVQHPMTIAS